MKKRKMEIKVCLVIVWTVCSLFSVAYWKLIGIGIWSMAGVLVSVGILASLTFLSKGMRKQKRATIWGWCVVFCVVAFFVTGAGISLGVLYEKARIQVRAENVMAEYMGNRGSHIENTKGVIRTDDVYARFGIWKTEKEQEEGQIVLLLVEITGEDIGPVREILLPISREELSGSPREKAGKPTQGPTIALYGGSDLFSIKKQRFDLVRLTICLDSL